jgi:C4-type Zn-finger protein
MQSVSNVVGKAMFWQQSNEAQVKVRAEFQGRLVEQRHGNGELCTVIISFT